MQLQRSPRLVRSARRAFRAVVLVAAAALAPAAVAAPQPPAQLPAGFEEQVVFSGLQAPTAIAFASDGRVFVAEKRGSIKVFDSLTDTTPTLFADLSPQVHAFWDRGLLGLALDPSFPTKPYVYVSYAWERGVPVWGDGCPNPPGATDDGCVVHGRVVRLEASGNTMVAQRELIDDWCHQYPSHSMGDLQFAPDGSLYVSGGEGAAFNFADYGQDGAPINPCGDPGMKDGVMKPPAAEGGALRSQDLRTTADPVALDGAILRIDPVTGLGLPSNPLAFSSDPNARRIIAYGMRNPFRVALRPGTGELWFGDVGWNRYEEINRIVAPADTVVDNFGWPCYEGVGRQPAYDGADLAICEGLYAAGPSAVRAPFLEYKQSDPVGGASDPCPTGASSGSGLAFYGTGGYPAAYRGALFFADYSRDCIFVMTAPSPTALPDPATAAPFAIGAANPVDLTVGPGGDLFYANLGDGQIRRIHYAGGNRAPIALATASPTSGGAPLLVTFDSAGSMDPDGDPVSLAWDLDGDGAYDDSTAARPQWVYGAGTYTARLRVADTHGGSALSAPITITAGNTPPRATIGAPTSTTTWQVGQTIAFSGSASDTESGALAGSALSWSLDLHHCAADGVTCHVHALQTFTGASGSFTAPDHSYPSYLMLRLTATDPGGLTDTKSVRLNPRTGTVTFASSPAGAKITWASEKVATPFTRTVIVNSRESVSAPRLYLVGTTMYVFDSWSDGGGRSHLITAPAGATTYTARYVRAGRVIVNGSPSGAEFLWDGKRTATPFDQWVRAGSVHTLGAPASQVLGGVTYVFSSWSDGGPASRSVTITTSGLNLTARFKTTTPRPAGEAPARHD